MHHLETSYMSDSRRAGPGHISRGFTCLTFADSDQSAPLAVSHVWLSGSGHTSRSLHLPSYPVLSCRLQYAVCRGSGVACRRRCGRRVRRSMGVGTSGGVTVTATGGGGSGGGPSLGHSGHAGRPLRRPVCRDSSEPGSLSLTGLQPSLSRVSTYLPVGVLGRSAGTHGILVR